MNFRFAAMLLALGVFYSVEPTPAFTQPEVQWSDPARLDIYPSEIAGTADALPQVATDNAGNWVAVWNSVEGVMSAHSRDLGVTWSPRTVIWEQAFSGGIYFFSSDIVYAGNNTWVATWLPSVDSSFAYAAFSTDMGQTWSTPQQLKDNTVAERQSAAPRGLATNGNGIVMVGVKGALLRSTDFGHTWSASYPTDALEYADLKIAYAGGDRWVLLIPRISSPEHAVFNLISNDNGVTWSESAEHYVGSKLVSVKSMAASGDDIAMITAVADGITFFDVELELLVSTDGGNNYTTTPLELSAELSTFDTYDIYSLADGTWMIIHGYDPVSSNNMYDGDISIYTASHPAGPYTKLADVATNPDIREAGPALETDAQGNLVMMYAAAPPHFGAVYASDQYDIYATHSTIGSASWSAPVLVSLDDPTIAPLNDTDVTIASGDDGVMIAVWESAPPLAFSQVVTARSADSGKTWSTPVLLGDGFEPRIIYAGQGRWLAWWTDRTSISDPVHKISDDNGLSWSANAERFYGYTAAESHQGTLVKAMALYDFGKPVRFELARLTRQSNSWSDYHIFTDRLRAIVHSGGSNWFVTTYDGSAVYASNDDAVSWTRFDVTNLPQGNVKFATDHAGIVTAVYPLPPVGGAQEIVFTKSTDNGITWTEPVTLTTVEALVTEDYKVPYTTAGFALQRIPAINAESIGEGRWVISWQAAPTATRARATVYVSFSTDDAATWSAPELAATYGYKPAIDAPGIAANGENVVVAWPFFPGGDTYQLPHNGPYVDLLYSFKAVPGPLNPDPPDPPDPGPAANLIAEWGALDTKCKTTKKGQKCQLKALLLAANVGELQAGSKSLARFYLSADTLVDPSDVELKPKKLSKLKPGKGKNIKVKLKAEEPFSGKYLIAVLDADGQVPESIESDNTIVSQPLQ